MARAYKAGDRVRFHERGNPLDRTLGTIVGRVKADPDGNDIKVRWDDGRVRYLDDTVLRATTRRVKSR